MKNRFKFLSLSAKGGRAKFRMMMPFVGAQLSLDSMMREQIIASIKLAASEVGKEVESLGVGIVSQWGAQPAPIQFNTVEELLPKETDYYYKDYRAISATLSPCYGLDFSKPGVLEAAVPLLKGQTVYKDHSYYSVDGWVGVVSESSWDAKGADSGGVPGINVQLKLDSKKDPMLVRGVAMQPPAVHSTSSTVLFEFEFSHPDLVEEGRFWQLLMEEVDGELVRLIVTKIDGFWEQSLVFQGAQEENKQLPAPEGADDQIEDNAGGEDEEELGARRTKDKERMKAGSKPGQQQKERKTVKVSQSRKELLGLTTIEGEEIADEVVLQAVEQLGAKVKTGDAMLSAARTECLRLATLATVGGEGQLPQALADVINAAGPEQIQGLTKMYAGQAEAKFPQTCQSCGHANLKGRSSVEDRAGLSTEGKATELPEVSVL